jgi:putative tryptophan/tyrosine transport system substrate-binding protein
MMKRRAFVALLGGAAAWPLGARAQERAPMRRIGVLMQYAAEDAEGRSRLATFLLGLQELGWHEGRNARIDVRWGGGDMDRMRTLADELVALAPDVILASASPSIASLKRATRTIPVVFANVIDPVGAGFVESLARPGGNITGFTLFDYALSGKWLELLKQVAPSVSRAAVARDAALPTSAGQLGALQSAAASLGIELAPVGVGNAEEIARGLDAFARTAKGGLVVTLSPSASAHRDHIVALALRHGLPAIYPLRFFAVGGGLVSYGPNPNNQFQRAAGYVDRILKGEKPADLPVQNPTRYELVVNLKTARALGLSVPDAILLRADEVIE